MKRLLVGGLWATMLAPALPATAQMQKSELRASAGKPYRFRHSKLVVPANLDGIPRTSVEQFGTDELDVFARYARDSDLITVYVYRKVGGAVPVWFDRARASIEGRSEMFGTVTPSVMPAAFTPPGQANASGLVGGWTVTKPPYRGTALALLPMGDWLVKIRYSSTTLDGPALVARMPTLLAALDWTRTPATTAPAAAPVADCATPLAFPVTAQVVRDEKMLSMTALTAGLLSSAAARASTKLATPAPVPRWCRDIGPAPVGGVYRPDAAMDRYLLAFSDSGRGVWVAPDELGPLLSEGSSPQWSIQLLDLGQTTAFPPMTALPRPDQVATALEGPMLSSTTTWGRKTQVNVNSDFMKGS